MIKVRQERLNSWPLEGTWENPLGKSHSSAQSVTRASLHQVTWKPMRGSTQERFKCGKGAKCDKCFQHQVPWRSMRGPTQGRNLSNARSVTRASRNRTSSLHQVTWNPWEDPLRKNSIQVRKVWQVFSTSNSLKEHERTYTREKPFKCS